MGFHPTLAPRQKENGETAMAVMDEGSKGGRRSVLAFGIVAAIMTVLLIVIGVAGKSTLLASWAHRDPLCLSGIW
jgi:arginine exporter protein ArgO